jgi:hypothetical protein
VASAPRHDCSRPQYEPTHITQQIVTWFAMRPPPIGVWRLPIPLPLAVVVTGCATLSHRWSREVELRQAGRYIFAVLGTTLATLLVAGAMLQPGAWSASLLVNENLALALSRSHSKLR